jgi:hypothetical protein
MAFVVYLIGVAVLLAGVGWFLVEAGFAGMYVGTLLLILLGLGVAIGHSGHGRKNPHDRP